MTFKCFKCFKCYRKGYLLSKCLWRLFAVGNDLWGGVGGVWVFVQRPT